MGRPRVHDQSTERDLLAAAERLLAAEGVDGLTVRRLAEEAGTTSRAIYSVFGGRAGLIGALFREAFVALRDDVLAQPVTDDPAGDLVATGVQGFRGWAMSRPALFRLVFSSGPEASHPGEPEPAGVQAFQALVTRAARVAPGPRAQDLAIAFHALCEGLAALEFRGRFPLNPVEDPRATWEASLGALVKGFRTD